MYLWARGLEVWKWMKRDDSKCCVKIKQMDERTEKKQPNLMTVRNQFVLWAFHFIQKNFYSKQSFPHPYHIDQAAKDYGTFFFFKKIYQSIQKGKIKVKFEKLIIGKWIESFSGWQSNSYFQCALMSDFRSLFFFSFHLILAPNHRTYFSPGMNIKWNWIRWKCLCVCVSMCELWKWNNI